MQAQDVDIRGNDQAFQFPSLTSREAQGCFLSISEGQSHIRINKELRYQIRERAGLTGELWATVAFEDDALWLAVTERPGDVDADVASTTDRESEIRINSTALSRALTARYLSGEEDKTRLHHTYETTEFGAFTLFKLTESD